MWKLVAQFGAKNLTIGALLLLLLTSGGVAWVQYRDRLIEQGRNEVLLARADSILDEVTREGARADSAASIRIDSLRSEIEHLGEAKEEAEKEAAVAQVEYSRALEEARRAAAGDSSTSAAIEDLQNAHQRETSNLRLALRAVTSQVQALEGETQTLRDQVARKEAESRAKDAVISSLRQALDSGGGGGASFGETLPEKALIAGGGYILGRGLEALFSALGGKG